jgi:hypothetical protein
LKSKALRSAGASAGRDVANAAPFLASDEADVITGAALPGVGGMSLAARR